MNDKPENHSLWSAFVTFSKANGIPLEYRDDWFAWWECFLAGVNANSKWIQFVRYMLSIGNDLDDFTDSQLDERYKEWIEIGAE